MSISRDTFLEKKVALLERRLTLVERFVESRFCESLEKFSNKDDEDQRRGGSKTSAKTPSKDLGQSGDEVKSRKSVGHASKPGPASVKRKLAAKGDGENESRKDRTTEEISESGSPTIKKEIIEDYTKRPRYNTRRGGRRGVVEAENDDDFSNDDGPVSPEEDYGDGGADSSYFTFPDRQGEASGNKDDESGDEDNFGSGQDASDHNWSGAESNDTDGEEKVVKEKKPPPGRKAARSRKNPPKPKNSQAPKPRTPAKRRSWVRPKLSELPLEAIAGSDPTRKQCPVCHCHFKNEVINSHMEVHMKERHLKCPDCDKAYFNQSMLRKHMRVHQPEKYAKKCRHCAKVFLQSDKVLAHERVCIKKALERGEEVDQNLVEDLKRRTPGWMDESNESPKDPSEKLECPHCKKHIRATFYDKHIELHSKTKNWNCNICDKGYFHKSDLIRHVAIEHDPNPTCELCEKSFEDRTTLKKHMMECRKEQRKMLKIETVTSLKKDEKDKGNDNGEEKGESEDENETPDGTTCVEREEEV